MDQDGVDEVLKYEGGRAGAIKEKVAEQRLFGEPITCKGGDIAAFNGFAPHRSVFQTVLFAEINEGFISIRSTRSKNLET